MGKQLEWRLKGTISPFIASRLITLPCTVEEARRKLKTECGLQSVAAIDFVIYLTSDEVNVLPDKYELTDDCKVVVSRCSAADAQRLMEEANAAYAPALVFDEPSEVETPSSEITTAKLSSSSSQNNIQGRAAIVKSTESATCQGGTGKGVSKVDAEVAVNGGQEEHYHEIEDEGEVAVNSSVKRVFFECREDPSDNASEQYYSEDDDAAYHDGEEGCTSDEEDLRIQMVMQEKDVYGGETQDQTTRRYYRNKVPTPSIATQTADTGQHVSGVTSSAQRQKAASAAYASQKAPFHDGSIYDSVAVHENYICHMCGQRGHHIRNCYLQEGKRLHKKIRPSTGIPVDFLEAIKEEDIDKYDELYQLKTGELAVMKDMSKVSGGAFFTKSADQHIQSQLGISESGSKSMLRELSCTICNKLFNEPVTTLCCGESYCVECIIQKSEGKNMKDINCIYKCPSCMADLSYADLQENTSLKHAVDVLALKKEQTIVSSGLNNKAKEEPELATYHGIEVDKEALTLFLKRQKALISNYLAEVKGD